MPFSIFPFPFFLFLVLFLRLSPFSFLRFYLSNQALLSPSKTKLRAFSSVTLFPFPSDFLSKKERKNAYTCDRVRAVLRRSNIRVMVDEHRDKTLQAKSRRPFLVTARRDHGKIPGRCPEPRSFILPDPYTSALWSFSAKLAPRNGHVACETPGRTQCCHRIRETEMRTPELRGGRHFLAAD